MSKERPSRQSKKTMIDDADSVGDIDPSTFFDEPGMNNNHILASRTSNHYYIF